MNATTSACCLNHEWELGKTLGASINFLERNPPPSGLGPHSGFLYDVSFHPSRVLGLLCNGGLFHSESPPSPEKPKAHTWEEKAKGDEEEEASCLVFLDALYKCNCPFGNAR
ncbi:hypothetical protein FRX31_013655 [Thalictrum thalictroides]|uniref:Uncharacterized protein n=1 Tax=Thalictrum thalictroides TaxID=46969 RepID=A0A7J6WJF0_THATH|nr:hypothetical protein FRX31_013655 [Thalictrum thalictroides]